MHAERKSSTKTNKQFESMATIELQSEEILEPLSTTLEVTNAENMTFMDGHKATPEVLHGRITNDQFYDVDETASLGKYLSRPVDIKTFTWVEGSSPSPVVFSPWFEFFNNAYIKNKIENFARVRCRLKLKLVLNASPFYYGSLRACYFPLEIAGSAANRSIFGTSTNNLIRFSQTPGVYLEPQGMSNVEMELPFVWDGDWLDIGSAVQFKNMGTLSIVQYAPLQSANGVSGTGVTVRVYAWAEQVDLAGPSKQPTLQSDEYEEGTVSGPATALANFATQVGRAAPILAPYARITRVGANLVSGVAKLFGYSNPPVIDDSSPVTVKSFHALANVETRVPMDVLALDPKNEVAFSSAVNGFDGEDELAIKSLAERESFILASLWRSTSPTGEPLFTMAVNPSLREVDAGPPYRYHYTVIGYISEMFRFWRGSLKYKFRFIKTKYHRGRVSITWDPAKDIGTDAATETTNFTRIVDLETTDEVELTIPYRATTPYLQCIPNNRFSNSGSPAVVLDENVDNGMLSMKILNSLTGPAAAPELYVLCYISAGDDFELAVPEELPSFEVQIQSEEVLSGESESLTKSSVTVGERVVSLRPLLHRTSYWTTQVLGAMWNENDTRRTYGWRLTHNYLPKVPATYGRDDPFPMNWASISGVTSPFNYCKTHPIDWVLNMFAAYKGSTNVTMNLHRGNVASGNATDISAFSATRFYADYLVRPTKQNRNAASTGIDVGLCSTMARSSVSLANGTTQLARSSGHTGMSLTNIRTQTALQVHVPQYTNRRLLYAWALQRNARPDGYGYIPENLDVETVWYQSGDWSGNPYTWPLIDVYYGAGSDFNPFFFVCAPSVVQTSVPAPVDSATPT